MAATRSPILAQYAATSQNDGDAGTLAIGVLNQLFSIFVLNALLLGLHSDLSTHLEGWSTCVVALRPVHGDRATRELPIR
jgi:hypothetical protein